MRDPYLYPNSEVLKNLADIHDEQTLKDMEADYTLYRLSEVVTEADWRKFDFDSLCKMHYHIFQDIYEWAGKPRIINTEKAEVVLGELSIEYSDCYDIERDANQVLSEMNQFDWKAAEFAKAAEAFADYMARLWKVHPYREGNTRTIVTFCSMFIESQGLYIESDLFKDNASYMRDALVAANAIFNDLGDLRKPEYLYQIVQDALEQGREMREYIERQFQEAGIPISEEKIHKIVFWNRKEKEEHTVKEIKKYLESEIED
ncbi:MAG: Fic family protein [Lacrimispora sp.]|uniref:Fic/DOC family protein n=1 Tax=Lacrimispora sp. TaxID=2719234 RepID=UPI0039E70850